MSYAGTATSNVEPHEESTLEAILSDPTGQMIQRVPRALAGRHRATQTLGRGPYETAQATPHWSASLSALIDWN